MSDNAQEVAPGISSEAAPSAEYVAQMTAAQHTDPTPAPAPGQSATPRPAHIPEKFWDAARGEARWDDLAKSYVELEKARSAKSAEEPAKDPAGDPTADPKSAKIERPEDKTAEVPEPVKGIVSAMDALRDAYAEAGGAEIDASKIEALEKAGIPRQYIETYLAGVKALEQVGMQAVHEAAGGKDKFEAASTWAAQNLSDEDLNYFNANCDNPATRKQAVEWLMSKYGSARPSEGRLVQADPSAASGDVFTSQAQITAAMQDRRYATDPAYREAVAQKLLRSQRAGTVDTAATWHGR